MPTSERLDMANTKRAVMDACLTAGYALNGERTSITKTHDGMMTFNACVNTLPNTEEEYKLLQSAVHIIVQETLASADVVIYVSVSYPAWYAKAPNVPLPKAAASVWITHQGVAMRDWFKTALENFVVQSCDRVITSYPWRDAGAMRARTAQLAAHAMRRFSAGQTCALLEGNMDSLLPPLEGILGEYDRGVVHRFVVTKMEGRTPASLLDQYEAVYFLSRAGHLPLNGPVFALAHALFYL